MPADSAVALLEEPPAPLDSCSPAPYGRACAGCSRAKCKCFYRAEGSGCERCHRLGRACEPSGTVRKRKAKETLQPPLPRQPPLPTNRLEEKLDDLVSLLRSQAVERQQQHQILAHLGHTPQLTPSEDDTATALSAPFGGTASPSSPFQAVRNEAGNPDVAIDTSTGVVHLLAPGAPGMKMSPIHHDVSIHQMPERASEEQLLAFRRAFISMFPFVHIPSNMSASELRRQKPFLWLNIMCLTTPVVSQQFAMEETIWSIVSKRIVAQHHADLDLLQGLICFASWYHYFKKDKPFQIKLAQLAVCMAFDLDLHNDVPINASRWKNSGRILAMRPTKNHVHTLEDRRSIIAVFHVTSSAWAANRKTEPLRWTPYMDSCLRILLEGRETHLDVVLATQVKCHIITNHLTCPPSAELLTEADGPKPPSTMFTAAMLRQLDDIQQSLPPEIRSDLSIRFYLLNTELIICEPSLTSTSSPIQDEANHARIRRLQDLDAILAIVERWMALLAALPLVDWVGVTMDHFAQIMQCLVVLFRLSTLEEPGWDLDEVCRRAEVFGILDWMAESVERVPPALGMVDAEGPRSGVFFKTPVMLRAVKALFLSEMGSRAPKSAPSGPPPSGESGSGGDGLGNGMAAESVGDFSFSDDLLFELAEEPWFSDLFGSSWDA